MAVSKPVRPPPTEHQQLRQERQLRKEQKGDEVQLREMSEMESPIARRYGEAYEHLSARSRQKGGPSGSGKSKVNRCEKKDGQMWFF